MTNENGDFLMKDTEKRGRKRKNTEKRGRKRKNTEKRGRKRKNTEKRGRKRKYTEIAEIAERPLRRRRSYGSPQVKSEE